MEAVVGCDVVPLHAGGGEHVRVVAEKRRVFVEEIPDGVVRIVRGGESLLHQRFAFASGPSQKTSGSRDQSRRPQDAVSGYAQGGETRFERRFGLLSIGVRLSDWRRRRQSFVVIGERRSLRRLERAGGGQLKSQKSETGDD